MAHPVKHLSLALSPLQPQCLTKPGDYTCVLGFNFSAVFWFFSIYYETNIVTVKESPGNLLPCICWGPSLLLDKDDTPHILRRVPGDQPKHKVPNYKWHESKTAPPDVTVTWCYPAALDSSTPSCNIILVEFLVHTGNMGPFPSFPSRPYTFRSLQSAIPSLAGLHHWPPSRFQLFRAPGSRSHHSVSRCCYFLEWRMTIMVIREASSHLSSPDCPALQFHASHTFENSSEYD